MIYGYARVSPDARITVNPRIGGGGRILDESYGSEALQRTPCKNMLNGSDDADMFDGVSRSTISRLVGSVGAIHELLGFYSELC